MTKTVDEGPAYLRIASASLCSRTCDLTRATPVPVLQVACLAQEFETSRIRLGEKGVCMRTVKSAIFLMLSTPPSCPRTSPHRRSQCSATVERM